jgi:hypothetical protein
MRERRQRRSGLAGRPPMRSPGRPPVARREDRQRFWKAIARGLSSEDAAVSCGVSPVVGTRWFREGGGMPSVSLAPLSGRYLSFAEREEIAILRAQGAGVRQIARRLSRDPRRSRESCVETPRLAAAVWTIAPRRRNGMPTDVPGARRSPNSPPTTRSGSTCRTGSRARSQLWAGCPCPARGYAGSVVVTDAVRPALGERVEPAADRGQAPSRLPR